MKKRIFAIILAMCLLCSSFVFAEENLIFDVIPYDFKLFWNGNELDFNSPVLLVNGQTYVPLRDIAEETGMDVNWNGDTQEIRMTEFDFCVDDVFVDAFGFSLPIDAEIVNYAYGRYGRDISFVAQIFFKESDLKSINNDLNTITSPMSDDERNGIVNTVLTNISKNHVWWDLASAKDAKYAYHGFMNGYQVKTLNVWAFICEAPSSDGYYLYITT